MLGSRHAHDDHPGSYRLERALDAREQPHEPAAFERPDDRYYDRLCRGRQRYLSLLRWWYGLGYGERGTHAALQKLLRRRRQWEWPGVAGGRQRHDTVRPDHLWRVVPAD